MKSAGSVRDELTAGAAVTRVGVVDLGTLTWTESSGVAGSFTSSTVSDIKTVSNSSVGNIRCAKYDTYTGNAVDSNTGISNALNGGKGFRIHDSAYVGNAAALKTSLDGVYAFYELATPTTVTIDPPLNLTYRTAEGGTESIVVPDNTISAPVTLTVSQGHTQEGVRDLALSAIAPVENHKASANYAVGAYLVHDGTLYKVTSAIASGESIVPGTNCTATTVMAELAAINA